MKYTVYDEGVMWEVSEKNEREMVDRIYKDKNNTVIGRFYVEQECSEPNPHVNGEIDQVRKRLAEIGLDFDSPNVISVVTNF